MPRIGENNLRVERIGRGAMTLENFVLYAERKGEEFSLSMPKASCS
jgi:aryl-alcohol dehydrogenase-like predicted oxidoreductase